MGYIYSITNNVSGKRYIGQTTNYRVRKSKHFTQLRNNCHYNSHLQNSWNKYKESNFSFELLEECEDFQLYLKEGYWIQYYNTLNSTFGYNKAGIEDNGDKFVTDFHKEKISQGVVNRLLEKRGRVVLIDLVTGGRSLFNSVIEMKKQSPHTITKRLSVFSKTFWCYETELYTVTPTDLQVKLEYCNTAYTCEPKKVFAFNFVTEELIKEFPSREEAARSLSIDVKQIGHILSGTKKSTKGYTFSENEFFPNIQKHRKDKKNFGKRIRVHTSRYKPVEKKFKYQITNGSFTFQSYTVPELVNYVFGTTKKGWQKLANGDRKSYKGYVLQKL